MCVCVCVQFFDEYKTVQIFRTYFGLKNCLVFFQMIVKHWAFFGTEGILSLKSYLFYRRSIVFVNTYYLSGNLGTSIFKDC